MVAFCGREYVEDWKVEGGRWEGGKVEGGRWKVEGGRWKVFELVYIVHGQLEG